MGTKSNNSHKPSCKAALDFIDVIDETLDNFYDKIDNNHGNCSPDNKNIYKAAFEFVDCVKDALDDFYFDFSDYSSCPQNSDSYSYSNDDFSDEFPHAYSSDTSSYNKSYNNSSRSYSYGDSSARYSSDSYSS
ncbi:hypothetical protein, partial [Cellulosilyticum ruminicola]|uniref:hypothetical protein n=1 Tax=Cellulosilyticum ruminicola TaxID=425254 RepID=UPI0006D05913